MTYDFNTGKSRRDAFSAELNVLVDAAIDAKGALDKPRTYLGASQVGDECMRRVQYEITQAPGAPFPPRIRRIFERGNVGEGMMAAWLRLAGFNLITHKPDGEQFGFMQSGGRYGGHSDGVLLGGPEIEGLTYPALWECKVLGAKGFKAAVKDGVVKAHPKYADQISQYQAYLDLADNPALASVVNADTMEIHYELIAFDAVRAQRASDRAALILRATEAGEVLPRVADKPDGWPCAWCSKSEHCWGENNQSLGPHRPGAVVELPTPPDAPTPGAAALPRPRPSWLLTFAYGLRGLPARFIRWPHDLR